MPAVLEEFQTKALNNLRERDNFKNTGQASLKVRVPNQQGGSIVTVTLELNKTGLNLREEISKAISIPLERLKVIFKGKFLQDESTLDQQGIKHGLHMMAIILKEPSDPETSEYESHVKQVDSTKADIELLSEGQYLQIADQSGKLLKLPESERKSLITAMTLHEKGRAALKKEDFAFALVMLLEAEKAFCQCNSSLLKSVDNYGVLSLDIVWCYLNLQSVTQLPDAEERLRQCEQSFQQSYGTNLERLTALKGSTGNESALFMRLHLLQAIVLYHQNRIDEAASLLNKAEEELKSLQVDDNLLEQLIALGYGSTEARLALRASRGDINAAITIIENKRSEKKRNREIEAKERKLNKKRKKLGKCVNNEWIDPELHSTLMSMGFSYEVSKWALARTNNNISNSIGLIHENAGIPDDSAADTASTDTNISDDSLRKVLDVGFDPELAMVALRKHNGDHVKAIEELLNSGGGPITDFKADAGEEDDSGSDSEDDGPSSSQLKKQRDEAYSRLKEGISNTEDDHLDLNLGPETEFLKKYKDLLNDKNKQLK
ncbi:UNVERIFIED_CONTAM: hypothetical protein PYX00_006074 [Menopon gallinae]|uniref:NEDD8 ultimate buster 1 n=1 Tax=Menopon gallinae TaxID=328185 RepID=A0AAW2HUJ8_9NEOP